MSAKPIDIKVWPYGSDGVTPLSDRPSYHAFGTDDGVWVILRDPRGGWSAKFRPDSPIAKQ